MKNLTTRKLVFGLLMACVLVFGVQSIADALTFDERRTGDLQTIVTGNEFTISFTVSLGSNTTQIRNISNQLVSDTAEGSSRINSSGYKITEVAGTVYRESTAADSVSGYRRPVSGESGDQAATGAHVVDGSSASPASVVDSLGRAVYTTMGGSTRATAAPDSKVSDAQRYHFNEEAISISVPTGTTLTKVGNYRVNVTGADNAEHEMDELASSANEDKLTSSIRLTFTAGDAGERVITITDETPSEDQPASASQPLSFTIFVVPALDTTTNLALAGAGANGYTIGNDLADLQVHTVFTGGTATSFPIVYRVEGSGRLYIREAYTGDIAGSPMSRSSATQTLSTSSDADVYLDMNGSSNKVTAYVRDRNAAETGKTVAFIFNYATIEIISGNNQTGVPNARLLDALGVKVQDSRGRPVPGLAVTFTPAGGATLEPVIGSDVYLTNPPSDTSWASAFAATLQTFQTTATVPASIGDADDTNDENAAALVPTDRSGEAQVYLEVGEAGNKTVAVSAGGATKTFFATSAVTTDIPSLEIFSGNNQRSASTGKVTDPLVVRVLTSTNQPYPAQLVTFTTTKGYLTTLAAYQSAGPPATTNGPATQVTARTDLRGRAAVSYDLVNHEGAADVIAEISSTAVPTYQRRVTFNINGTGTSNTPARNPYLSFSTNSLRGSPGQQVSFTVSAYNASGGFQNNVSVNLSSGINIPTLPASVFSGESVSITLPNSNTSITANANNYNSPSPLTINVQAVPDEIVKVSGDSPVQTGEPGAALSSTFVVRVEDRNDNPIDGQTVTFRVTGGGGSVSPATTTTSNGRASTTLTLGSASGTNTVEASVGVSGVSPVTFTATARATVLRLQVDNGNNQMGEVNSALDQDLSVRIVDQNLNGIARESVTFRTVEGSGSFSPSSRVLTDTRGYAAVTFTPSSAGTIEIEASSGDLSSVTFTITTGEPPDAIVMISGNNQSGRPEARLANPFVVEVIDENDEPVSGVTVTFAVTAGGGTVSVSSATTGSNGRAQTRLTLGDEPGDNTVVARVAGLTDRITFRAKSGAEVLVRAAQRPPLYWIDRANGTLHRLVDEETEDLVSNLKGALSITVDVANDYIYWTAQTGENRGAIRRAGLNGRGAQTLKAVSSIPVGIAVDSAGGTIYWTNSRGNILSMPVAGGKVTNIAKNLSNPGPIALSNGVLYWGEETGRVRRMSLTATPKTPVNIATGLGAPLAVAVAKGKVYWVERSNGGGRLQRANLNGSNIQQLKTFASGVPIGFAIDSSENKIYWTKGAGKIQRASLGGKFVKDIVVGLPNPGSIALGAAVVSDDAPTSGQQPDNQQTNNQGTNNQQTTYSQYDINRDGAVNNADTRIVSRVISGAATNPRADVDGSGEVDVTDLILVIANLDDDVAAPAIDVDVKALDLDFDRVQEQVEMLLASGDTSIAAQRALLYLQHLLASARPDETVLLANYPNPFNPETWIPYHLAASTEVRVNIYDAQGVLVRALTLGHQSAGYYTSRSRAAYWDGRNAFGERVASGIYFYQLQTDAISPMRKMVILK